MVYRQIKGADYSIRKQPTSATAAFVAHLWEPWGINLSVGVLSAFLMRGWLGPQLPSTPRQEGLTELHFILTLLGDLRQGRLLAQWYPLEFSGSPWMMITSWPFYLTLALIAHLGHLAPTDIMKAVQFISLFGSGLAMYLYVRTLLGERLPAAVAAVVYLWVPCHAHLAAEPWIHAPVWALLPLILYAVERMLATTGRRRWAWAVGVGALAAALAVITSEFAILGAACLVAYLLVREAMAIRAGRSTLMQSALRLLLIALVAGGLAAFYVLPVAAAVSQVGIHAKHGAGSTFSAEVLKGYVVTPGLLLAGIAKRTHLPIPTGPLPRMANAFFSVTWYPGLVAPALGVLGLAALRRQELARVALGLLALATLQALAGLIPGNPFAWLPVIKNLFPFRSALLVVLFASVLAGYGAQIVLSRLLHVGLVAGYD